MRHSGLVNYSGVFQKKYSHQSHESPKVTSVTAPRRFKPVLRAASAALLTVAVMGTGSSAVGAGTHLCDGYQQCAERGLGNGGYARVNDRMYWRMYPGHNCTNYVAYRLIKSGLPNTRPWSGSGNATYWGRYMSRYTDSTPRVGAIAWWNDGGPGHVAVVERVVSSSEIIISQDSWGGDFSWARVTKAYRWPAGFIHFNDRRLDNRSAPRISGPVKVGNTVTASSGSWKPAPSDLSYSWRMGGQVLPGAKRSELRITPRMLGRQVQVTVTAQRDGYPATSSSSAKTQQVLPGTLEPKVSPDLRGTAQVHRTMTVTGGQWTPRPVHVSFQWLVDGEEVPGATGQHFDLTARHAGHRISVAVTAKRVGYAPETKTFTTSAVNRALLHQTRRSSLTGSAVRGQVLEVQPGAVKERSTRYVRWLRDGEPIKDATDLTYELRKRDVTHEISARVTYAKAGYRPVVDETGGRVVRGTLRIATKKTQIRRGVLFDITATVAGQRLPEDTRVVIRNGGRVRASGTMHDGHLKLRVKGLPRGHRTLWLYFAPTKVSANKIVSRQAWFR